MQPLSIAMLSIHSSPLGAMGTKDTGGMSVVVTETARELGNLGNTVDIYTAAGNRHSKPVIPLDTNVRLIHLDTGARRDVPKGELFHHLPPIYEALNNFMAHEGRRYDALHSHYWLSGVIGHWAQKAWGVPHVITFHTLGHLKNVLGPEAAEPDLRIEWEGKLARSCRRLLVATRREKDYAVGQWDIDVSKVGVVPFGVNMERFDIGNSSEVRKHLDLDTDGPIILFVGRFVPLKGVERLLEAFSRIDHPENMLLVLIGGDGPDAGSTIRLKALSFQMGIGEKVRFVGAIEQSDLALYYNAADILVLPSYYESFGLVVLESMACGTPVVATPVGIVDAVLRNGRNGRIVEDPTAAGIAASIMDVLRWIRSETVSPGDIRASIQKYAWAGVTKSIRDEYATAMDAITMGPANR